MFEDAFLFFPARYPDGDWQPPGLAFEDAWFEAADGTRLHGWYVPHPQPRAAVVFAHGNAGNVTNRAFALRNLHALRTSTLIFDYRGFGRSQGRPSEAGILLDGRAARDWHCAKLGLAPQAIVLLGESLGGAVAVDIAAEEGCRGLVLENTFASVADVAVHHFPFLPVRMFLRTKLDSAAKIGRYHGPLLQVHGDADTIIPIESAQRLFAAANEPKRFVVVPGGDHNDLPSRIYVAALDEFLDRLP